MSYIQITPVYAKHIDWYTTTEPFPAAKECQRLILFAVKHAETVVRSEPAMITLPKIGQYRFTYTFWTKDIKEEDILWLDTEPTSAVRTLSYEYTSFTQQKDILTLSETVHVFSPNATLALKLQCKKDIDSIQLKVMYIDD